MRNKPDDCTDEEINRLFDDGAPALNAETIFHVPELESYYDCNGKRCYRQRGTGARIQHENYVRQEHEKRRRYEAVSREVLALKLDKIDPDWPSKFLTTDAAARFYREELAQVTA
jgi:hypothetical protein